MAVALLLAVSGCEPQAAREAGTVEPVAGTEAAPPFELTDLAGQRITLSAFAGRPVIVSFWAPWVVACSVEAPALQRAYVEGQKDGLIVLGVAEQGTTAEVRRFARELGLSYPILLDSEQRAFELFGAEGIPSSVFVDRRGRIRHRQTGLLDAGTLTRELERIRKS